MLAQHFQYLFLHSGCIYIYIYIHHLRNPVCTSCRCDQEIWNFCNFHASVSKILPRQNFNISTSDQCCFNVVDQRINNVDPTLKMKQNPTSNFQRCATLIQRWCATLKQRWNNVDTTLSQFCSNLASTLVKAVSKPVGLVISTDS